LTSKSIIEEGVLSKPTFKQILDALKRQVLSGKSYMAVAKGLQQADPVILQTAPTFFGLTMEGCLELAQMAVARPLRQDEANSNNQEHAARCCCGQLSSFQRVTPTEASEAVLKPFIL
jgi:hypothetical protein